MTWEAPVNREEAEALACQHGNTLLGWFRRLGLRAHDAEDCAQDTLLRVQLSLDRYEPRAPFTAFLRRVSRSVYVDWCRRQRVRRAAVTLVNIEDLSDVPAASTLDRSEVLDLQAAVSRLPDKLAVVIELSVRQGLSYREVASRLGIPIGTVKSRMFLAVQRLRKELGHAS